MKNLFIVISATVLFIASSCNKTSMQDIQPANNNSSSTGTATRGTNTEPLNMPAQMLVYYNYRLYTAQAMAYDVTQYNNHVLVHSMYVITEPVLPGATPRFVPVISDVAAPAFSFQNLWEKVYITFRPGLAPYQFLSADEITKLLFVPNSPITATKTSEFFEMRMFAKEQPASMN